MSNYEKNGWEREFLYYMPDLPLIGEWADKFDVDDYMSWFQEININTTIWQLIIIAILIWYHKETKRFLEVLTDKIAGLIYASRDGMLFDNDRIKLGTTKWKEERKVINEKTNSTNNKSKSKTYKQSRNTLKESLDDILDKDIENYKDDLQKDPNGTFANAFNEMVLSLRALHSKVIPTPDQRFSLKPPQVIFYELVDAEIITSTITEMFNITLKLRNAITHGKKPLKTSDIGQIYLKAIWIFNCEINSAIEKHEAEKKKIVNR